MLDQETIDKINSDECPLLDACAAIVRSGSASSIMTLEGILRANLGEERLQALHDNISVAKRLPFYEAEVRRDKDLFKNTKPKLHQMTPEEIERDSLMILSQSVGRI